MLKVRREVYTAEQMAYPRSRAENKRLRMALKIAKWRRRSTVGPRPARRITRTKAVETRATNFRSG